MEKKRKVNFNIHNKAKKALFNVKNENRKIKSKKA